MPVDISILKPLYIAFEGSFSLEPLSFSLQFFIPSSKYHPQSSLKAHVYIFDLARSCPRVFGDCFFQCRFYIFSRLPYRPLSLGFTDGAGARTGIRSCIPSWYTGMNGVPVLCVPVQRTPVFKILVEATSGRHLCVCTLRSFRSLIDCYTH